FGSSPRLKRLRIRRASSRFDQGPQLKGVEEPVFPEITRRRLVHCLESGGECLLASVPADEGGVENRRAFDYRLRRSGESPAHYVIVDACPYFGGEQAVQVEFGVVNRFGDAVEVEALAKPVLY